MFDPNFNHHKTVWFCNGLTTRVTILRPWRMEQIAAEGRQANYSDQCERKIKRNEPTPLYLSRT
jgi:hypothetical protein